MNLQNAKTIILQIVRTCSFTVSVYKCLSAPLLERLLQDRSSLWYWWLLALNYSLVLKVVSDSFLLATALSITAAGSNAQFCARVIPH